MRRLEHLSVRHDSLPPAWLATWRRAMESTVHRISAWFRLAFLLMPPCRTAVALISAYLCICFSLRPVQNCCCPDFCIPVHLFLLAPHAELLLPWLQIQCTVYRPPSAICVPQTSPHPRHLFPPCRTAVVLASCSRLRDEETIAAAQLTPAEVVREDLNNGW